MGQRKKKKRAQKKRCLNKQKWEVLGTRMNGTEFENMSAMNSMMQKKVVRWKRGKIGKKIEDG